MKSTHTLLKISINTITQSIGKIITASLGFISVILLTRYLGPTNYGNFTLVFAYLSFYAAFADFGLQTTIIKQLAHNKHQKYTIYPTFFWLKVILAIISNILALIILLFFHYPPVLNIAIAVGALALIISDITSFSTTIFQAEVNLKKVAMVDILTKVVTILTITLFILLKANFYFIVLSVTIGNLAGLFYAFHYSNKTIKMPVWQFDWKEAVKLMRTSLTIGIATLLSVTYFKLDTIMLSVIKGSTQVGIYSLAYKIFENMLVLWWFYLASFYPLLAKFHGEKEYAEFKKLLKNSLFIASFYAVGIIFVGYFFAPFLIEIFGGKDFTASIAPLRILVFSSFFFFVTSIFYYYLFIKNKTYMLISCIFFSLLFNFITNLLFIPRFGYIGASYTTIATEGFLMLLYIALFLKEKSKKI